MNILIGSLEIADLMLTQLRKSKPFNEDRLVRETFRKARTEARHLRVHQFRL